MNPSVVVLLTAIGPLAAGPVPKGAESPLLFYPTTVGTKWTYTTSTGDYVQVVTGVEEDKGGAKVITVGTSQDDGPVVPSEKVRVSDRGLAQVGGYPVQVGDGKTPLPPPAYKPNETPVDTFRPAARPGDTWEGKHAGGWTLKFTAGPAERIKVPAGEYEARVVEVVRTLPNGRSDKFKYWYAPGMGPVKWTHAGGEVVLKSFALGKK